MRSVDTNTWSILSAYSAFCADLHAGVTTKLDVLLNATTIEDAATALNNFAGMRGDLGHPHALEYLHIIDRTTRAMPWTGQHWDDNLPGELVRSGPNAKLFLAWANAKSQKGRGSGDTPFDLGSLAIAVRAELPLAAVWQRKLPSGEVQRKELAFIRWNAADTQQTACKVVQVAEKYVAEDFHDSPYDALEKTPKNIFGRKRVFFDLSHHTSPCLST